MMVTQKKLIMRVICNRLSKSRNAPQKQAYIDRGAFMISASDLENIRNEIRHRDTLDYIEESDEEEISDHSGDESDDESDC